MPGLSGNFMYYALFLRTSKCREIPDFCSIFLPQIDVEMEMALRMSAQFNFDCLGHKELKKYSIQWALGALGANSGRTDHIPIDYYDY